jgi:hypothetical protein
MIQLLAKSFEQTDIFTNLDLSGEVAIALNKSIEEIEDITQRKATYSKTFVLPGTATNETFFRSAFNVNSTDFNNSLLATCVIQSGGNDIFNGTLRLNKVIVTPNGNNYEVYLLQEVADFSKITQDFTLCDLDFRDVEHDVTYDNIIDTWSFTGGSYTNYSGIVGKVLYPLCDTGYDSDIGGAFFDFSSSGLTNSGTPLSIGQFKPWFNAKYLLDKVFEKAGFIYSSQFFDSDYFESLFLLAGTNNGSGTAILGDRPENQNFFNVTYEGTNYVYPQPDVINAYNYIVFNTEQYDYLQQYTLSNFPDSGPGTGGNHYTVPIDGAYQFRVRQRMFLDGVPIAPTYVNVVIRDIDTGTVMDDIQNVLIPVGSANDYNWLFSATLTAGQRIAVQFQRVTTAGDPSNTIGFSEFASFESFVSPTVIATLGDIKIQDNLMCMTGLDYFKNLIQLFNLTTIVKGENELLIEPYVNFLSSNSGNTLDWSSKLDYSQSYEIEPLDYSLNQEVNFTYKLGNDYLSQRHFENFNKVFGELTYTKNSQLLKGILDIEIGFESMPTDTVGTSGSTMVVPSLYKFEQEQTIQKQSTSNGSKLGFYCGLTPFYTADTSTILATYYIASGATTIGHNYYPAINHLSHLTDDVLEQFSDLNFASSWDFFGGDSPFLLYTPNNVYNQFYRQYINLLYSDEARLFTGKFILTPEDVANIDFNDTVYFLNSTWRLYEINDADITQESVVQVKFIKQPFELGEITLYPPDYSGQTVTRPPVPTPTPTPGGCNEIQVRISTSQSEICNERGTLQYIYSDCPTLSAGCKVYFNGFCTFPESQGKFLYPAASYPTTYVFSIVDTLGTIAQANCP